VLARDRRIVEQQPLQSADAAALAAHRQPADDRDDAIVLAGLCHYYPVGCGHAARLLLARSPRGPAEPFGSRDGPPLLLARLNRPLADAGEDPRTVVTELARDVDPGLVASAGPRYFGFGCQTTTADVERSAAAIIAAAAS
jgi:hypothetical protein